MKTYYVYILECADGSFYTGITNDVNRRLDQHQSGMDVKTYTYGRRPVKLVFEHAFNDVNQAIAFEKQVKGWRREKKLALIEGRWKDLPELSKTALKRHPLSSSG